jgi:hypothetical protein
MPITVVVGAMAGAAELREGPLSPADVESQVDTDIDAFDTYQQHVLRSPGGPATPLTRYERAAIKTYIAYKLGLGPNDQAQEQ